jgi:hypothetical protein
MICELGSKSAEALKKTKDGKKAIRFYVARVINKRNSSFDLGM